MKYSFLFIILLSANVFGDEALEEKKSNYRLNVRYKGGPYLIYDCVGSYYACVDADSNELCKADREKSKLGKEVRYPCAPLEKFPEKKKCLLMNYTVLEKTDHKRFCYPK